MAAPALSSSEMLARLVAFDTVSAKSNLALIDFVADYLAQHGVASTIVHDETKTKADLFATLGPDAPHGVVLSGHTDVVPVEGQNWRSDPFVLADRDGRFYGRGTADMKGFIAVTLAAVPAFLKVALRRPIHLVLSYDEEVGCLGIRPLLAKLGRELPKPAIAIVGEPTEMKTVTAHKGVYGFETNLRGVAAHSSAPHAGVSAIAYGADLVAHIRAAADKWRREGVRDDRFTPPWTTVNIGQIDGGTALNIIPEHCRVRWEFRPIPAADVAALENDIAQYVAGTALPRMRAENATAEVTTRSLAAVPGLQPEENSAAEALVSRLTGANRSYAVAFAAEAGLYQQTGISTVICGPGNIAQAHQPDEWIDAAQLRQCETFLERLADWAATS